MINHFPSRGKKLIKFHFLRKKLHNIITLLFSGTTWFLFSLQSLSLYSLSLTHIYWQLQDYFLGSSIRNINYTKFKTKENLNISTSQKIQKIKTETHKVLQLFSTMFHILKSLHDIFVINPTSNISFNVYSQTSIYSLISYFIDLFQIVKI